MAAVSKKSRLPKVADHPHKTGELRSVGGSPADAFNHTLADQVVRSLWLGNAKEDERERLHMGGRACRLDGMLPPRHDQRAEP